ncbi:ATP-binding protein [Thalassolituus sp. UBA3500]|uniref:ATP-binding protein n=1 Tax=Thalassolituus sp. UBA3500 TaxID=1947664 RepID=UPI00263B45B3|nr:ATP-binding protein [Thalassolituus sp. UBA3500]|tara:strand:+ start:11210 stop:13132 length:1923 start_codon:yes stop_codon:yes gene_type:complete
MNDLAVIKPQADCFNPLQQWTEAGLVFYTESLTQDATAQLPSGVHFQTLTHDIEAQWKNLNGRTSHLIQVLNLSPAEVFVLFIAGMMETQPRIAFAINELQQPSDQARLSIHLALDMVQFLFPDTTDWDVLDLINTPLFNESVITVSGNGPLSLRELAISVPLWSVIKSKHNRWQGVQELDSHERELLPAATRKLLPDLCKKLTSSEFLILRGQEHSGRSILAAELGLLSGYRAMRIPYQSWQDEPQLRLAAAIAGWLPVITPPDVPGEDYKLISSGYQTPAIIITGLHTCVIASRCYNYALPMPDSTLRQKLWSEHVEDKSLAEKLAGSALLSGPMIKNIGEQITLPEGLSGLNQEQQVRTWRSLNIAPGLTQLAQAVTKDIPKEAVIFPTLINEHLDDLIARALQRESLYRKLGDTLAANQNPGLRALFVGASGTGKTLAASYIASQIGAPLFRVDLGSVINKYIGESEKNLGRLLDYAAATDTILLFDEAESVFGNRTDARSSNERFANNLTNYLLSRIETHPGIVILTSNHRDRIDPAFNRRLEIIIDFPQPGFNERLALWGSHMGQRSPDDDFLKALASHCDLSGGQIRNAVLSAAANSPDSEVLGKAAIIKAISREYQKLGKSLPAALQSHGVM